MNECSEAGEPQLPSHVSQLSVKKSSHCSTATIAGSDENRSGVSLLLLEAQLETIEKSDPKETKEAAKEELFQISTRTHFDDIFERYSHYSQPDPYILCFETLKEVEYAEKKLWTSLGKSNMEEGRVVTSVLNSQVQSKITEAVDFVFGESAFWNPAAKAKALLFK
ncbi:hypothetical protein F2Q68_00010408 [Brassica cretica]|uniref:Uncharacterized protein n=1 Tax=Brassica cretica TaxID=69181 RepID=A0A8S9KTV3_BRACR|nr:hypothetical protein F2Q68_00010408 [Brassica cretica]